jgi:hypothetical protein
MILEILHQCFKNNYSVTVIVYHNVQLNIHYLCVKRKEKSSVSNTCQYKHMKNKRKYSTYYVFELLAFGMESVDDMCSDRMATSRCRQHYLQAMHTLLAYTGSAALCNGVYSYFEMAGSESALRDSSL